MSDNNLGTAVGSAIGKLGFGYMRLPKIGEAFDYETINTMVDTFLGAGFTYFDTAYMYKGAEEAMRETLVRRYPREKFQIATKLPIRAAETPADVPKFFETSIKRLGTDYVDFYMLHGINGALNEKAESFGAWDYLKDLKSKGSIRHFGFSFHGSPEELDAILQKHPEAEFVQLQINYLDWDSEQVQSRRLYETARKHHKPVTIMEPIKGGMLASESSVIADVLKPVRPDASVASWALRFAASLDGLITVLSGMGSLAQMQDNIATVKSLKPLGDEESAALSRAVELLRGSPRIGCTGCRYCVEGCPQKINIPIMMNLYSDYLVYNTTANVDHVYEIFTRDGGTAKSCVACRSCEEHCPQNLGIVETISKLSALLD